LGSKSSSQAQSAAVSPVTICCSETLKTLELGGFPLDTVAILTQSTSLESLSLSGTVGPAKSQIIHLPSVRSLNITNEAHSWDIQADNAEKLVITKADVKFFDRIVHNFPRLIILHLLNCDFVCAMHVVVMMTFTAKFTTSGTTSLTASLGM